ncbi:hypothetical protein PIROE2DRAFT_16521 [Piromyces sp. E2]|nr:hypothetical protein PIROE2DRAFT_16521 [Piromyces sp. E2]|eukprot:OUM58251.1 hypothetical protein PIROE2DRAFT_16521 [Piromyces sp. E2]
MNQKLEKITENSKIKKTKKVKEEYFENEEELKNENESESESESESEYEYEYENNEVSNSDSDFEENSKVKKEQTTSRKRKRVEKNNDEYIKAIKQECEKITENFSSETPSSVIEIRHKLCQGIIPSKKKILMRYFKTGPGEYADGDQFFGIPVPGIRSVVQYCNSLGFDDIFWLFTSTYHEERMLASLYMTELAKKIVKEEIKKNKNKNQYLFIQDSMNAALKKYKCHTIPELIHHFVTKPGWKPGERQGWDITGILSVDKRQKEKNERIGESRPVFLDINHEKEDPSNYQQYEYKSHLGFTDPLKIQKQILFEFYVECMPWIDNWDLVDLTCRDIVGGFLVELNDEQIKEILYHWLTYKINDQVAGYSKLHDKPKIKKENSINDDEDTSVNDLSLTTLWTKRVAIICTFYFINNSDFRYTIFLLEKILNFSNEEIHGPEIQENMTPKKIKFHDLIEKASGWMLREIGKRDGSCSGKGCKCILKDDGKTEKKRRNTNNESSFDLYANKKLTLIHFLNKYAWKMPRTMLRYSIEKLSVAEKSKYLNATEPI